MKMGKYPYSFGEAVVYSIIFFLTLWWIPIVGPIIIGYLTGRKAGGPIKGIAAMAIPIVLYFMIRHLIYAASTHIPQSIMRYVNGSTIAGIVGLPANSPIIHYFNTSVNLATSVGINIESHLYYVPSSFFIMIAFAFVGGTMSRLIILERGIYPQKEKQKDEKEIPRKAPKPYNPDEGEDNREDDYNPAPVSKPQYYVANPAPVYAQQPPPGYYGATVQQYNPYQQYPQQYPQQFYPATQMQQYNPYAQNPYQNSQIPRDVESRRNAKIQVQKRKQRSSNDIGNKKRRKRVKEFEEGDSKFVVHPMDTKKNVLLKGKRINVEHSIDYL
jgi:chromate transport protein ChrA